MFKSRLDNKLREDNLKLDSLHLFTFQTPIFILNL